MKAGGVLFIDEAYQLKPKVVVIAGYCKPIDDLMAFNEGLPSRFPERFVFEDYSEKELLQILMDLVRAGPGKWRLAEEIHARIAARRMARQSFTIGFGNARAVRNLLDRAKK